MRLNHFARRAGILALGVVIEIAPPEGGQMKQCRERDQGDKSAWRNGGGGNAGGSSSASSMLKVRAPAVIALIVRPNSHGSDIFPNRPATVKVSQPAFQLGPTFAGIRRSTRHPPVV